MASFFSDKCKEMLREHLYTWTFARVTSVQGQSAVGVLLRVCAGAGGPPRAPRARTIWFKTGKEVPTMVLGPVLFLRRRLT